MADYMLLPIEVGQIWEARTRRGDGSRERVTVERVDGRAVTVLSANPRPRKPARRSVGVLITEIGHRPSVGNMRLVALADGRRVTYPSGGGIQIEEAVCES